MVPGSREFPRFREVQTNSGSGEAAGAAARTDREDLGGREVADGEVLQDLPGRLGFAVQRDQGDGAAAEAAAGHARAECTGRQGRLDGGVQLLAGDLEVVAQRVMRV